MEIQEEIVPERELGDAADPKKVRASKKKEKKLKRSELDDLSFVLGDKRGRRLYWNQMKECGIYRESFVPNEADSTAYNEGQRNIGLRMLAKVMDLDPTLYIKMAQEAKQEE